MRTEYFFQGAMDIHAIHQLIIAVIRKMINFIIIKMVSQGRPRNVDLPGRSAWSITFQVKIKMAGPIVTISGSILYLRD